MQESSSLEASYRGCYIEGPLGQLYLGCFGRLPAERVLLYLPPFAEEMNLSRAVVSRQAYALANQGWTVVLLDYYGTGDSEGELVDVTVGSWLDDVDAALCWLKRQGAAGISIWGLRFGGLLAYHYLERRVNPPVEKLLLWAPVLDAKSMLKQFFRSKQISQSLCQPRQPTSNWLSRTLAGELSDVAGYQISPRLARSLVELTWGSTPLKPYPGVLVEIGSGPQTRSASRLWAAFDENTMLRRHSESKQFWQVPEVYDAPKLIEQTSSALGAW